MSTLDAAASEIYDMAEAGEAYGALVLDNHFCDLFVPFAFTEEGFDGVHFAQALLGRDIPVAEELFDGYAEAITQSYRDRIILFSGSAESDADHNPKLFQGVTPVTKRPDDFGVCCEQHIIAAPDYFGIFTPENTDEDIYFLKGEVGLHRG